MDTGVNCIVGGNDDVLWVEAFKIVPEKPPRKDYPDYAVGFTYVHVGTDIELCQRGFHASPTFKHCAMYVKPGLNCRFLRVKMCSPKWDDSYTKCVSNKIEICQEYTYEEVLGMKCVFIKNGFEYHTKGFNFHCQDKAENGHTLPAYIGADGTKIWYTDDKIDRPNKDENGYTFPAYIGLDGSKRWYTNDKLGRQEKDENGYALPAWIGSDGSKSWYTYGRQDRQEKDENGHTLPAYIGADGSKRWFKNGIEFFPTGANVNSNSNASPSWTKIKT